MGGEAQVKVLHALPSSPACLDHSLPNLASLDTPSLHYLLLQTPPTGPVLWSCWASSTPPGPPSGLRCRSLSSWTSRGREGMKSSRVSRALLLPICPALAGAVGTEVHFQAL